MSLFGPNKYTHDCGAIIDVGSGSVGVAIVVSDQVLKKLEVVWSYREHMPIKDTADPQTLLKEITTTIVNVMLEVGTNGLKALHAYNKDLSIGSLQIGICAPWSYTVTKTINYKDEKQFTVTTALIQELITAARKETMTKLLDGKLITDLGLRIISEATVQVRLNGYTIEKPIGDSCTSLTLSHIHSVSQEKIAATIEEMHNKLFPKTELMMYSFMYLYYQVLMHMYPDTSEICLVDVTNEATEIGIVRDNVLQHTTHTPVGIYTLARDIAKACSIPKDEALSLLKDAEGTLLNNYGQAQQASIIGIYKEYEETITKLLNETGDKLSIPRTLFLHTSRNTEAFFSERLATAARASTNSDHSIHLFTSELLGDKEMSDSALALSAHYFHTHEQYITPINLM